MLGEGRGRENFLLVLGGRRAKKVKNPWSKFIDNLLIASHLTILLIAKFAFSSKVCEHLLLIEKQASSANKFRLKSEAK